MASLVKSTHHLGGNDYNPLTMSDEQILEQICSTHVDGDSKCDVDSLFTLVENILKRSIHIVDNVVQGTHGSPEHLNDKFPQASFSSPLCDLKQISSEMCCKPAVEQIAHKSTLAILNKLSSYSWETKVLLTLAAFALEYGEFLLLSLSAPTDPLAKSVAILKRVPVLTNPSAVRKHRQTLLELNNLIKTTLHVIELIFELEKLTSYDTKDVPALAPVLEQIPVDAYWAIITIVSVVTQIDCLTTESDQRKEVSQFGEKINITLSKLTKQMSLCSQQIEEAKYYKRLRKIFQTPTEITEVFKVLIFRKDTPQAPIYDSATKTLVSIYVLKKKNVVLFISTLDIIEEEISILMPIYNRAKTENQYNIVWVPIVEEWNDQLIKKFESLKSKMPWYVLQHFAPIKGFKFIKEEWQFKKQPMVVVMNHQGKIQHSNAFHMIQVWGSKAFPPTQYIEDRLAQEASWIESLGINIQPPISEWQKYIFFYGGKDKEWIKQFTKHVDSMKKDAVCTKAKISIESFCTENGKPNTNKQFWRVIESLFVIGIHEVEKLLSYKSEIGWALLSTGSTVVLTGHGSVILDIVEGFNNWKDQVINKGFEISFKEQLGKFGHPTPSCSHLEIPNVTGKIPERIKCPECPRTMEVFISYKCCHNESTASAEH